MTTKLIVKVLCILALGFGIGWCASWYTFHSVPTDINIVIPDSLIKNEKDLIDSLKVIEKNIKEDKKIFSDSVRVIIKWREEKIKEIKSLPLDSGIKFFEEEIKKYE